jgi:hypothetical protein
MDPRKRLFTAIIAASAAFATPALAQNATVGQPTNNCAPTDKIDGTSANDAQKKLEAAGYTDITGLNKGCDNVWHAQARASGNQVNVMVAPDGSVNQETN